VPSRAVILDIEGTITPIAFVRDVLFPFARARLPDFLREHANDASVAGEMAQVAQLAPGTDVLAALMGWMDQDAKVPPLKTLQGLIWQDGYNSGLLMGRIYGDVPPVLREWRRAGVALYIYSSGSVAAQKLLLGHSDHGNLCPLFSGYFDTHTGGKRETASYTAIAAQIGLPAGECLFLSDVAAELEAAEAAGMRVGQLVRPEDGTVADARFPRYRDFNEIVG
jgi:enolase-phosphatase E1